MIYKWYCHGKLPPNTKMPRPESQHICTYRFLKTIIVFARWSGNISILLNMFQVWSLPRIMMFSWSCISSCAATFIHLFWLYIHGMNYFSFLIATSLQLLQWKQKFDNLSDIDLAKWFYAPGLGQKPKTAFPSYDHPTARWKYWSQYKIFFTLRYSIKMGRGNPWYVCSFM